MNEWCYYSIAGGAEQVDSGIAARRFLHSGVNDSIIDPPLTSLLTLELPA